MAALFHQQLWRRTLGNTAFRATGPPFFPLVRLPTLQIFQRKVLSTSIKAGEVEETEPSRHSSATRSALAQNPRLNIHLRKIYVGNVFNGKPTKEQRQVTQAALFEYFSKFGEVELMEFPRKRFHKLPPEYGFVTFRDVKVAQKVLADAESHIVDGQNLKVSPLRNKKTAVQEMRNLTVLVKNVLNTTSKQAIEEHFSQFGKVDRVFLAHKDPNDEYLSSYYVMFSSSSGVQNALERPVQRICRQSIDSHVKKEFPQTTKVLRKTNKLVLTSVPDELTVEDLREYFQQFGEVKLVELLVNKQFMSGSEGHRNVAFVHLASKEAADEVVQKYSHIINGLDVKVKKQRELEVDVPDNLRHLKLSVEGIPSSIMAAVVKQYLERTFNIVPHGVYFDRSQVLSNNQSPCIVRFSEQRHIEMVLKKPKVTFEGHPLYFRRLVWKKN